LAVKRIVALRALKLGDFLVAVPALRAIRRAWPDHEVVLATSGWLRPVVTLADCVDTLAATHGMAPLPAWLARPELAVNLHGAGPQSNAVLDALEPAHRIGHAGHGWPGPVWVDGLHERERWCRLLRANGVAADAADLRLAVPGLPVPVSDAVVVHPGAAYGSKRWPVPRFAAVAAELRADGHRVVITGGGPELQLAERLAGAAGLSDRDVLAGRTGLAELAALVAHARLIVSGDTGIAHLAYAFGTPSVTLFGPAPARLWGPPPDGPHRTLSADLDRLGEPFAEHPDPALLGVSVADVLGAVRDLLAAPDRTTRSVDRGAGAR
jgi:ADP-heptose:LPS heptosyltransferase